MIVVGRPRAPRPLPERLPAAQPLRVRDPPALAAVPDQRRAAAHDRAGARPPSSWTASRRRSPTPRPSMYSHVTGVTSPTGDEAEGWLITVGGTPKELLAHSPEFTYSRLLAGRREAQEARRAGHGPRCVHQGRRRRRRDGGQAGVAADHHRQQLQRLRCAVGRARGAASGSACPRSTSTAGSRARRWSSGATGAIGSVCARLLALASDELWLVSPGDRQAARPQGRHRAGEPARGDPRRRDARRGTCPTWT